MALSEPAVRPSNAAQGAGAVRMSYAVAAGEALAACMRTDARVVALGEDLGRGGVFGQYRARAADGTLVPLQRAFGAARIIDTPISEANIMGAAVGMALAGLRPVAELRIVDFALCGMDELINQAAKNRFMFGGQGRVPMVIRMPIGIWSASAAQHSQSLEAWFAHVPGLVVACPATPRDNHALLRAAIECDDPVVYLEHKELWGLEGDVDAAAVVPLGRAHIARAGSDLTIVAWSRTLHAALAAADALAGEGTAAEIIDLRTLPRGPRGGARLLREDPPPAGRARGRAGRGLRRRDRSDRRRSPRPVVPRRAHRCAAHPGGLRRVAGSRVARRRRSHHRGGERAAATLRAPLDVDRTPAGRARPGH